MTDFSPASARALDGPDWLAARRVAAAEAFAAEPHPDPEAEEWRYSPISALDLDRFAPASGLGDAPMARLDAEPAATVRSVNGRVVAVDIADGVSEDGVFVGSLVAHPDAEHLLGAVADTAPDHFSRLNDAFVADAVVVDVPAGVVLDAPVVVTHHASGDGNAAFPRLIVRVGADAEVEVLDRQTSDDGAAVLVCPVVELDVGPAGRLGYLNVQELGDATWQLASQLARADRDATIAAATAAFGGSYARQRADTRLRGRGAHGDLLAAYFGDGSQTLDFRTHQDHVAPDTTSNLLFKGVLDDRARAVYTGLIRVGPDARGTNAFQTNRNLKLSDDAWAESVPNLEIENNDVKCSHASTVSPVDDDQRFYLESRGVPTDRAERLIVAGFLDEVFAAMPVAAAAPALRSAVAARLEPQGVPV